MELAISTKSTYHPEPRRRKNNNNNNTTMHAAPPVESAGEAATLNVAIGEAGPSTTTTEETGPAQNVKSHWSHNLDKSVFIAVMGITGAGKSHLIRDMTQNLDVKVSASQHSCTYPKQSDGDQSLRTSKHRHKGDWGLAVRSRWYYCYPNRHSWVR